MKHEGNIKSAADHVADIDKQKRRLTREEREFRAKRQKLEDYRRLRDDVVSTIRNDGRGYQYIEDQGGPKIGTISRWEEGRTDSPKMAKMVSALAIIGKRFYIGDA